MYDAENRIVSIDSGAYTYAYDHQNRRVKKVGGGSNTHYVWEGAQAIGEYNGSTGAQLVCYYYAGSRMIAKIESGATRYFLRDRLSTRVVLDGSGNVVGRQAHLPFGEDFGESGTQEKRHFTSYERDGEVGSDYAINRQYVQSVGRFNRVDPDSGSYKLTLPQKLNRYAYVRNNPINKVDALGLDLDHTCEVFTQMIPIYVETVEGPQLIGYAEVTERVCKTSGTPGDGTGGKGGSGGAGQVSATQPAPLSARKYWAIRNARNELLYRLNFGQISDRCRQNVIDKLERALGFNLGDFVRYLSGEANFYDGTASNILVAGNIMPSNRQTCCTVQAQL